MDPAISSVQTPELCSVLGVQYRPLRAALMSPWLGLRFLLQQMLFSCLKSLQNMAHHLVGLDPGSVVGS